MPVYPRKCVFGTIFDFPRVLKAALETTFSSKKSKMSYPAVVGGASWSRPGHDLAPKALQGRIFLDLGPFLVDFGRIFDDCLKDFQGFPTDLGRDFG